MQHSVMAHSFRKAARLIRGSPPYFRNYVQYSMYHVHEVSPKAVAGNFGPRDDLGVPGRIEIFTTGGTPGTCSTLFTCHPPHEFGIQTFDSRVSNAGSAIYRQTRPRLPAHGIRISCRELEPIHPAGRTGRVDIRASALIAPARWPGPMRCARDIIGPHGC